MSYAVIVEEGQTSFRAYVPDLPGWVAVAETRDEVARLIEEAIEFHVEACDKMVSKFPRLPQVSNTWKFARHSPFILTQDAARISERRPELSGKW
jgi:predicted RNase H-like HicB family nuclease